MMKPVHEGRLLQAMNLEAGDEVLEIGTGSGFTSAVMARLADRVFTVDRYRTLIEAAQQRFERLGLTNIAPRHADGSNGMKGEGTFDRILVTAAFSSVPRWFVEQLAAGGVMIAPLMDEAGACTLVRLTKIGSRFEREDLFSVPLSPMIPNRAAAL
jgi:protein-L-isoaspartate(D-aspartate) O-methyltransferase